MPNKRVRGMQYYYLQLVRVGICSKVMKREDVCLKSMSMDYKQEIGVV